MHRVSLALIVVVAGVTAVLAAGHAPTATEAAFPGKNGAILFARSPDMYSVNPDGTEPTNLTETMGGFVAGADFSPDGEEIAVGVLGDPHGIVVMDADGANRRQITDDSDWEPAWSPDGRQILFTSNRGATTDLWVMNKNGSNPHQLTGDKGGSGGSWSPDGHEIAYSDRESNLSVIDANGSHPRLVATATGLVGSTDWSPDGSTIAYDDLMETPPDLIKVVDASGGQPTTIAEGSNPRWSPDGTQIAYTQYSTGRIDHLATMDADGSNQHVIADRGFAEDWGTGEPKLVHSVEFTQEIQELQALGALETNPDDTSSRHASEQPTLHDTGAGNDELPVPIVAGKPAFMRIYMSEVDATAVYELEASGDVNGSRFVQLEPGCTPEQRRTEEGTCKSVDFAFTPPPGPWSVTLKVRRQQDSEVLEEHEFDLSSVGTVPLVLKPVIVCDHLANPVDGLWDCGSLFNFVQELEFLRATFPGEVSVAGQSSSVYADTGEVPPEGDWWSLIGDNIRTLWTSDGAFDNLYEFGVVRPAAEAGTAGGVAFDVANASAGKTSLLRDDLDGGLPVETGDELVAHLLGSNMGLKQAPSAGGCYGTPAEADPDWPTPGSPATGEVGYDIVKEEPTPETNADWMSLCTPRWISPYTANRVVDEFRPATARTAEGAGLTKGDFWLVSGRINLDESTTEFDPIFQQETQGDPGAGAGPFRMEVQDAGENVLFTRFFAVDRAVKEDEGQEELPPDAVVHFGELVPVQAGATKIVLSSGDDEVGEFEFGGTTPVVQLTSGLSRAGSPPLPVFSWEVADADSATHTYWVELSRDSGETWQTIAPRYAGPALPRQRAGRRGRDLLLRVLASDGANTGAAVSEPFNMQTKPPQGAIASPTSGSTIGEGDLAWLQSAVVDPEDGFLEGSAIRWSSSRDGDLGTGASLQVYDLSLGTHTISLLAEDSDGNELADSITITVTNGAVFEGEPTALAGDVNCSGVVDSVDGLGISRHVAGLTVGQTQPCPPIGIGTPFGAGDVNCSGEVDAVDALFVLRFVAGLPVNLPGGCREIGT